MKVIYEEVKTSFPFKITGKLRNLRNWFSYRKSCQNPEILSFRCETPYIVEGGYFTLSWETQGAIRTTLEPIGDVSGRNIITLKAKREFENFILKIYGNVSSKEKSLKITIVPFKAPKPAITLLPAINASFTQRFKNLNEVQFGVRSISLKLLQVSSILPITQLGMPNTALNKSSFDFQTFETAMESNLAPSAIGVLTPFPDQALLDQVKACDDANVLEQIRF